MSIPLVAWKIEDKKGVKCIREDIPKDVRGLKSVLTGVTSVLKRDGTIFNRVMQEDYVELSPGEMIYNQDLGIVELHLKRK